MSLDRVQLGRTIRRLRDVAGLSQHEIAANLEMSRSSLANIEVGRQAVGLDQLIDLAAALGTTVSALLAEEQGDRLPVSTALIARLASQQREIAQTLAETAGLVHQLAEQAARTERLLADALGYDLALIPREDTP